jgi:hypothetical protein
VKTLGVSIIVACLGTAGLAFGHGSSNKLPVPGQRYHAVTQATLGATVCVSGYTATIRPPVSYTPAIASRLNPADRLSEGISRNDCKRWKPESSGAKDGVCAQVSSGHKLRVSG